MTQLHDCHSHHCREAPKDWSHPPRFGPGRKIKWELYFYFLKKKEEYRENQLNQKNGLFKKISNIYKPLATLIKKKIQITKLRKGRGHHYQSYRTKKEATQMASKHSERSNANKSGRRRWRPQWHTTSQPLEWPWPKRQDSKVSSGLWGNWTAPEWLVGRGHGYGQSGKHKPTQKLGVDVHSSVIHEKTTRCMMARLRTSRTGQSTANVGLWLPTAEGWGLGSGVTNC